MNCPICYNKSKILYSGLTDRLHQDITGVYTLKRCLKCRCMYIDPQPSKERLDAHYPENYDVYQKNINKISAIKLLLTKLVAKEYLGYGKSRVYSRIFLSPFYFKLSHLPRWIGGGKLLDVGCGTGVRLSLFKELGWDVEGLEMNNRAAKVGQNMGFKIYTGAFEDVVLPDNHFDVVYLNNVFEHLINPHAAIKKIVQILKHKGQLCMVVPNENSFAYKIFKRDWPGLDVPRHLFTYNEKNITKLLNQYGFVTTKVLYMYAIGSFTSSIAYKMRKHVNTFSFFERSLWMINLFIDPLLNIFKIGDWMVIHAQLEKDND